MKRQRLAIVAIIIGLLLAVGVRLWSHCQAAAVTGPTALRQGADGRVYLVAADHLMAFTEHGELLQRIPLSRFGLDEFVGDFLISTDRQILLRARRPEGGLARWLRVQFRIGGDGGDQTPPGEAALQWCPLAGGPCRPFGPGFRSTRTFRLALEPATGAVLIADTAQHRLMRLSAKGVLEATSASGAFRFPNALLIARDGLLHVADTNHHRIAAVSPGAANLGELRHEFAVQTASSSPDRIWPMGLAQAPDDALWTINASGNMAYGDVMVYEADGRPRTRLKLPANADPLSLLALKDRVLVADPVNFDVNAFDLQGQPMRRFGDDEFFRAMEALQRDKKRYDSISNWSMLALLALAGLAWLVYRRQA